MLHLKDNDSMYIDEAVSGFAIRLVNDGIVPRQVDLLLIGFGYSVQKRIIPADKIKRHDLLRASGIQKDSRLAVEAVAPWFAREMGLDIPEDERSLLDLICRIGSAGIAALQKEWEGRAKSQIELSILKLGTASTTNMVAT